MVASGIETGGRTRRYIVMVVYHQRIPAPRLRAIVASSAIAVVKRARFALTCHLFEWLRSGPAAGRSRVV